MKILIKGAGLTGCAIARLLKDKGHRVLIIEKKDILGGLCATETCDGLYYDKFGPHYFRSSDDAVIDFMSPFLKLNNSSHYVGSYVNGRIFDWPISEDNVTYFENVFDNRACYSAKSIDVDNFEQAAINTFSPILYELFVKHYTRNMWHRDPKKISAKMASRIFHINRNDKRYFREKYQGYPEYGYTTALKRMIDGIDILPNRSTTEWSPGLTIDCSPIDEVHQHCYQTLEYVGMKFENKVLKTKEEIATIPSEWYRYSCLNFPNCEFDYIRATIYKNMTRQLHPHEVVSYEYPSLPCSLQTHPVISDRNETIIRRYLLRSALNPTTIPAGRMGLFKYLSMDTAVKIAIKIGEVAESWSTMSDMQRFNKLIEFRETK